MIRTVIGLIAIFSSFWIGYELGKRSKSIEIMRYQMKNRLKREDEKNLQ